MSPSPRSPAVVAALMLATTLLFLSLIETAHGQVSLGLGFGATCNALSRGYTSSLQYFDNCNSPMLSCNPINNTCSWKTCSNVDFIKNWNTKVNANIPQRCPAGLQYCPDNALGCKNLMPLGSPCESQRDDECLPSGFGICMNYTCFSKTVGLGGPCGVDYQQYNYAYNGLVTVTQNIYRDNCSAGFTCDLATSLCVNAAPLGAVCTQDRDCFSQTCSSGPSLPTGQCINPPDTFQELATWQWAAIGSGVFVFVLFTLLMLFLLHRLQRRWEQQRIAAFFGNQEDIKREMGFTDMDDARSSIVLATPQADFKRRSTASADLNFLRSGSANASHLSFQSDSGVPGRLPSSTNNPQTGNTFAEDIKLQYQHNRASYIHNNGSSSSQLSGTGGGGGNTLAMPSSGNGNRRSHPLMHGTTVQGAPQ